jgi:hypothetical protein
MSADAGPILFFPLGLLFLLVKETRATGWLEVTVRSGPFVHQVRRAPRVVGPSSLPAKPAPENSRVVTRRSRELRDLVESSGREFAADDAERKANEARRRGEDTLRVERSAPERAIAAIARRVERVIDLFFGHGPLPIIGELVAVILLIFGVIALGDRGGREPSEAVADEAAADATDSEILSVDGPATGEGAVPVGTYEGVFTDDIGDFGRIFQTDTTETSRTELANVVSLVVAEDGSVTGTLQWSGEQHSANDLCTAVRVHSESGAFEGTADVTGTIEGRAWLSGHGTAQATCDGVVSDVVPHDSPETPFPFTATIVDGHLEGEITGIFAFAADRTG